MSGVISRSSTSIFMIVILAAIFAIITAILFVPQTPDLIPIEISYMPSTISTLTPSELASALGTNRPVKHFGPGDPDTITVTIQNQDKGSVTTPHMTNVTIQAQSLVITIPATSGPVFTVTPSQTVYTTIVPGPQPLQSQQSGDSTVNIFPPIVQCGLFKVEATTDDLNTISESNENNNVMIDYFFQESDQLFSINKIEFIDQITHEDDPMLTTLFFVNPLTVPLSNDWGSRNVFGDGHDGEVFPLGGISIMFVWPTDTHDSISGHVTGQYGAISEDGCVTRQKSASVDVFHGGVESIFGFFRSSKFQFADPDNPFAIDLNSEQAALAGFDSIWIKPKTELHDLTIIGKMLSETEELPQIDVAVNRYFVVTYSVNSKDMYKMIQDKNVNPFDELKIQFRVDSAWLEENNISTDDITLQRFPSNDGVWEELQTELVSENKDGSITLEATTSGPFVFAVTGKQ